ncbi:MAG: AhpC/TSA family protein [Paludibacteraceae bacterium]|nr:AhpC/TSA family protein [Paludibacteraceae bacterium]
MKKYLFLISAIVFALMSSCQKGENYVVKGTIDKRLSDFMEPKSPMYIVSDNQEMTVLDSTIISDDLTFEFKGNVEEPKMVVLNSDFGALFEFVLEKGEINVCIDSMGDFTISGTPNNELLNDVQRHLETSNDQNEVVNYLVGVAKDNINNVVGQYVFSQYYLFFSEEAIDGVIDNMNEQTKQVPDIAKTIGRTDTMRLTMEGKQYIDITLPTAEGPAAALSDFVGKTDYVLVDFWASWCGPCRRAMPALVELYEQNRDNGRLEIVGISLDTDPDKWQNAISNLGLAWKHMSDMKGWKSEAAEKYGVYAIPNTLLIDRNGKIVARNLEPEEYAQIINKGAETL